MARWTFRTGLDRGPVQRRSWRNVALCVHAMHAPQSNFILNVLEKRRTCKTRASARKHAVWRCTVPPLPTGRLRSVPPIPLPTPLNELSPTRPMCHSGRMLHNATRTGYAHCCTRDLCERQCLLQHGVPHTITWYDRTWRALLASQIRENTIG